MTRSIFGPACLRLQAKDDGLWGPCPYKMAKVNGAECDCDKTIIVNDPFANLKEAFLDLIRNIIS